MIKKNNSDKISLCIPRLDKEIHVSYVSDIFKNKLKIGLIDRVEFYYNKDNTSKKAFLYFREWYNNPQSEKFLEKIKNEESMKIMYEFPNFWKCVLNTKK
jgi:hypothetical protein